MLTLQILKDINVMDETLFEKIEQYISMAK